ncbi:MAG: hypothetical protein QM760_09285 [Nibricoccus sp.]
MISRRLSFFALAGTWLLGVLAPALLTPALHAATIQHDLQQGLAYLRTGDLSADLSIVEKTLASNSALVLDLRHTASDDESAATLGRLLSRPPATARFARFILVSGSTSPALLKQLTAALPGVVILSAKIEGLTPDISVGTTPEEDTLAYDALTSGVTLDKLLSGSTPQKVRYDEATLVRDHANGGNGNSHRQTDDETGAEPVASEQSSSNAPVATVEKPTPQPVDRVLLRAVQLHRTLLALKKL